MLSEEWKLWECRLVVSVHKSIYGHCLNSSLNTSLHACTQLQFSTCSEVRTSVPFVTSGAEMCLYMPMIGLCKSHISGILGRCTIQEEREVIL